MRKPVAVIALVLLNIRIQADESWFEGHWVLDRDATFAAMSDAGERRIQDLVEDPSTESEISEQQIRDSMYKAEQSHKKQLVALWDSHGDIELQIDAGNISQKYEQVWSEPVPYSLRPIERGVFEVLSTHPDGAQWRSLVRRTRAGFCKTVFGPHEDPPDPNSPVFAQECFRRHGA